MKHLRKPKAGLLLAVGAATALLLAAGCARHYTITLSNGSTVTSSSRPRLVGGFYVYTDDAGQEQRVNELRVREISSQ